MNKKKLVLMAGPCVIESEKMIMNIAKELKDITSKLAIDYYFKSSFDKANRTSLNSYRGTGIDEGMKMLEKVKDEYGLRIVTDIHEPWQAEIVAKVVDIIQIPAFLCRQTDLIIAAAKTGKKINVKKGQFLAPWDMKNVITKIEEAGNKDILLCERGVSFGYNCLIVDMTSMYEMKQFGYPVIFDGTHSVQKPGENGTSTGGNRQYIPTLTKAAIAAGADGLFLEVHPNPDQALSDGQNSLALSEIEGLLKKLVEIYEIV